MSIKAAKRLNKLFNNALRCFWWGGNINKYIKGGSMKKNPLILVVEDEAIIAKDLCAKLEELGFETTEPALTADSAVEMAVESKPDLILMDICLNGSKTGLDAAECISQTCDIPIVFLTSYTDKEYINRAQRCGAYGYLVKPYKKAELNSTIHMALHCFEMDRVQKEREQRFKKFAGAAFEGILMVQGNIIVDVNDRLAQMFGYTVDNLVGKDVRILFLPLPGEAACYLMDNPGETLCEARGRRKDSSTFYVEIRTRVTKYPNQTLKVMAVHDIDMRIKAQTEALNAHDFTHKILEESPFGVLVVDDAGMVEYINPAMIKLSGEDKEDLMSTNLLYHEAYIRAGLSAKLHQALLGDSFFLGPVEYSPLSQENGSNDRVKVKNFTGVPFKEDGKNKVVVFIEDISKRMSVEAELKLSFWKLQKTIESTVYAIAKMVEKRDPYTAGHQERVAELATAIAEKMGLAQELVNSVNMAAIIHDVGKMYVPAEILSKPGQLSDPEFNMIKTHPTFASDILGDIEFPWPVVESVTQHHERYDGSGYPAGLKGDEIIQEARIIAVADVVEAMASHRPYRPSLGIEKAIAEIKAYSGTRYDPVVVSACVDLYHNEEFDFSFGI